MHYSIIINPLAGNGKGKTVWKSIQGQLDQQGIHYHYHLTKKPGDAEYLASRIGQNKQGHRTVIVLGGDGTLHDVLNGLLEVNQNNNEQVPLAYIPVGVNNDFAHGYGISTDPLTALQQILHADENRQINVGYYYDTIKKQGQYFLNNLGIGFDAALTSQTNLRHRRRPLRRLGYLRYALSVLYNQQPFTLMIQHQGDREFYKKAYITIIANHPYSGGRFQIAPTAKLVDDSLDLIIAERRNWLITFWQIWQLSRGKLATSRFATHLRTRSLHCTTTSLEFGQVDGEEIGNQFMDLIISTITYPFHQKQLD